MNAPIHPAYPFYVKTMLDTGKTVYVPFSFEQTARDFARDEGGIFMTSTERRLDVLDTDYEGNEQ